MTKLYNAFPTSTLSFHRDVLALAQKHREVIGSRKPATVGNFFLDIVAIEIVAPGTASKEIAEIDAIIAEREAYATVALADEENALAAE